MMAQRILKSADVIAFVKCGLGSGAVLACHVTAEHAPTCIGFRTEIHALWHVASSMDPCSVSQE